MKIYTNKPQPKRPVIAKKKLDPEKEAEAVRPAEVSTARTFRISFYVPPGKNYRDSVDWVQKFFDFYHPTLEAKVTEDL